MSHQAGLLRAVLDAPADDAPRLVYADWLDEHGDQPERAEFIRVQVEYAALYTHLAEHGDEACPRCARGYVPSDLLTTRFEVPTHGPAPFARDCPWHLMGLGDDSISGPRKEWGWHRGFVETMRLPAADWHTHGDMLAASHPIRDVTWTTWPSWPTYTTGDERRSDWLGDLYFGDASRRWPGVAFHLPESREPESDNEVSRRLGQGIAAEMERRFMDLFNTAASRRMREQLDAAAARVAEAARQERERPARDAARVRRFFGGLPRGLPRDTGALRPSIPRRPPRPDR